MNQQTAVELIAWNANGAIQSFLLESNQAVLVGKSSNCGLQLSGHEISDIHCSIGFEDGHLWVEDWMSAMGTRLNGEPLTCRTQVGQGSVVELGHYKIQISKSAQAGFEEGDYSAGKQAGNQPVQPDRESLARPVAAPDSQPVTSISKEANRMTSTTSVVEDQLAEVPRQSEGAAELQDRDQKEKEPQQQIHASQNEDEPQSNSWLDSNADFDLDDDEVYDRETVELLQAEIEDLRTALAQQDAEKVCGSEAPLQDSAAAAEESEKTLHRIQELVEEANRADERVLILEEMLQAAEDANRSEVEERTHLEAWVGDIEKRVGQREQEHAAELEALRERLKNADEQYGRLQRRIEQAATTDDSSQQRYEETMEKLQQDNRQLQEQLADAEKDLRQLMQKYENQSEETEVALREERAKIAKEHAEMSRLKYDYAQKLKELEESLPKSQAEIDPRLQSLREHRQQLREMSQQKKKVQQQAPLSSRLKRLWNLVE